MAKITNVVIDEAALEEAAKRGKGVTAAVNQRARQIRDAANGAGHYVTPLFFGRAGSGSKKGLAPYGTFTNDRGPVRESWLRDKPGAQVVGNQPAVYLYKPATYRSNPHAIVYTANYAAVQFEHKTNTLLKVSR